MNDPAETDNVTVVDEPTTSQSWADQMDQLDHITLIGLAVTHEIYLFPVLFPTSGFWLVFNGISYIKQYFFF